jgi:hypothetical protein
MQSNSTKERLENRPSTGVLLAGLIFITLLWIYWIFLTPLNSELSAYSRHTIYVLIIIIGVSTPIVYFCVRLIEDVVKEFD